MEKTMTVKVMIIGMNHPHTGETGVVEFVNGKAKMIYGDMYLVKLDNCPLLTDACYATQRQMTIIDDPAKVTLFG